MLICYFYIYVVIAENLWFAGTASRYAYQTSSTGYGTNVLRQSGV